MNEPTRVPDKTICELGQEMRLHTCCIPVLIYAIIDAPGRREVRGIAFQYEITAAFLTIPTR
jgi:hypothetical protein